MSFRSGSARPPAGRPPLAGLRWPRLVLPVIVALIAFFVLIAIVAGVWTDFLWYRAVHYSSVFGTTYGTRWAMFFVAGLFMAVVTGANAALAYRLRPIYRPVPAPGTGGDAYRMAIDPHRRLLLGLVLGLVGVISGITAAGSWRTWLLFANQVKFNKVDPQFKWDLSFFIFTYPFIRMVLSYLFAAVLLSLVLATLVHYLYGGLRMQGRHPRVTMAAQAHLFLLFGVFVLLKAVAYWVDRYGIDFSRRGAVTTGASYTDVNAVLPAKTVLAVIAVLCALLFFAGAARRSAMLPAVGFGLLVLSAILIGGLYPAIIQQFVVKPNELAKETPYIHREIRTTRQAYGLSPSTVRVAPYSATTHVSQSALAAEVSTLKGMRLLDPDVVSPTFQQLQQVKSYYQFPANLAMDRYLRPGAGPLPQDTVVAVRGMGGPPPGQGNWINTHLVYTHGFGVVAATANTVQGNGNPSFVESDIPPRGNLGLTQPRVYFGEGQNAYAIVGGPSGGRKQELDYPSAAAGGQQNNTYHGSGGVDVGSPLNRLLYTIKFRELNILLSGAINSQSKILYDRQPLDRVAKVAPFLTLDGNPYPVVANGQILWVVDGYTTTGLYPYSQRLSMGQATATSDAPGGTVAGQPTGDVNYIRNSVKAVVNAYTGSVTLYQWDARDPILRTWMKAFPGVIKPKADIPAALTPHLRYPPDLFEVQRQILTQFHVLSAQSFYGGQGFWAVPDNPGTSNSPQAASQPPYYQTMQMPGAAAGFSLTSPLVQRGRQNLAAYMAVDSNPQSPDYGTIRVLQLPQDTAILGPQQVQSTFESDPTISSQLSLYRQNGSKVIEGNLITLPVGGALVYEEPIYIQAAGTTGGSTSGSYPVLKRVAVSFNGNVGFAPTLSAALSQVIPGLSASPGSTSGSPGPSGSGTGQGSASTVVRGYLAQAETDYAKAQAALKTGDFASYGKYTALMKKALDQAQKAAQAHPSSSAKATPSPSASP
ncbi:MAG: uncharacterized protein QOG05_2947 [Streptosporangiaceae bacterium]|nr:uncharacterized protein [Streptosporangiaceae bacterium]